jgi:hypothetical protein
MGDILRWAASVGAALELEQIASALPSKMTKSCQRPAGRIASAALDDCRVGRSVWMSNLDR